LGRVQLEAFPGKRKLGLPQSSRSLALLLEKFASTSDDTSSLGGDETTLLTAGSVSTGSSGVTHVLMVTTTVRMLDGVHGNTSNSGPVSLLGVSLVVGAVGSEEGLVSSLTASDDADHSSASTNNGFTDARWESDSGLLTILGVTDDDGGGAGSTGEGAAVSELGLTVSDDGTFGHHINGEDVTHGEGGFGAAVDELAGVHAFDSDEILNVLLEFVAISEDYLGEGGASAGIVHDVLDNSLDISTALSEVEGSESRRCDSLGGVCLEDSAATTSLSSAHIFSLRRSLSPA
jgi:hypothetical protein